MQFLTPTECQAWLSDRQRELPSVANSKFYKQSLLSKDAPGLYFEARRTAATLMEARDPCLLWIEEWGIWSSSENLHLYYRLRESYGDRRLLEQAPGHLFLNHETEDLATFLHVAMLHGWGGYLLSHSHYLNAFFSHDGFIEAFADDESRIRDLMNAFES